MCRLRILTWPFRGSYLNSLAQCPAEFYLPCDQEQQGGNVVNPLPDNIHLIPREKVRYQEFDCVLYQHRVSYLKDRFQILCDAQRHLPSIYLEHDSPPDSSGSTRHIIDDPNMLLVHVTNYNQLMWDCGSTPTRVIEHGVCRPNVEYTGEISQGIVITNDLGRFGRQAGADIFTKVRNCVPLELVGARAAEFGGIADMPSHEIGPFMSRYRFFFTPRRQGSLNIAVCEAMMIGMPIVGLATQELVTVVENGVSGYLDTDVDRLTEYMLRLLQQPALARRLGEGARRRAAERFDVQFFADEWEQTFREVTSAPRCEPLARPIALAAPA